MSKGQILYLWAIAFNVGIAIIICSSLGFRSAIHEPTFALVCFTALAIGVLVLITSRNVVSKGLGAIFIGVYAVGLVAREIWLTRSGGEPTLEVLTIALLLSGAALEWKGQRR
jgi:hypothetical protein